MARLYKGKAVEATVLISSEITMEDFRKAHRLPIPDPPPPDPPDPLKANNPNLGGRRGGPVYDYRRG